MNSSAANACVPALGGLSLILGGTLALYVDRLDLLHDKHSAKPVLLRYTSAATFDLRKRPHWIFLISSVIFAPLMVVSCVWQSSVAQQDDSSSSVALAQQIKLFGTITAACTVAVAASPMGNFVGSIFHILFAGGVASLGINYCVRASQLASDRGDTDLANLRMAFWIMGSTGAVLMMFTLGGTLYASSQILQHELHSRSASKNVQDDGNGTNEFNNHINHDSQSLPPGSDTNDPGNSHESNPIMTSKQIFVARCWECATAVGQVSVALSIGLTLITAAVEVGDVGEDVQEEALIWGVASAASSLLVLVLAYLFNGKLYRLCQDEQPGHEESHQEQSSRLIPYFGSTARTDN